MTETNKRLAIDLDRLVPDEYRQKEGFLSNITCDELMLACVYVHATECRNMRAGDVPDKWAHHETKRAEWALHELCHASLLNSYLRRLHLTDASVARVMSDMTTIEADANEIATLAMEALVARMLGWKHMNVSTCITQGQLSVLRSRASSLVSACFYETNIREAAQAVARAVNERIWLQREGRA